MTKGQPIAPEIAEAAAEWIVRRDGGDLTPQDERAFAAWQAHPDHRAALDRLEKVWGLLDEEPDEEDDRSVAELPALRAAPVAARMHRKSRRLPPAPRRWIMGGIAAAVALVMMGGIQDWPTRLRADYATGIGERRDIALSDGSVVRLDSGSAIALDYSGRRRVVRLLAGAALFEVAPDRARPFTVKAEGGSVTALGTAFAVRDEGDRAVVTVTRHSVRVEGGGRSTVVAEGQSANFAGAALSGPFPAQGDATAWTRGRLVVVDRPLGEVVSRIAGYRRGFVTVTGPAATIRVSGVYDLDHPLAAIDSIEKSHGLTSLRLSDRLIILRR